jgi:hypothetical protein
VAALERHIIELAVRDGVSKALRDIGITADQTTRKVEDGNRRAARSSQDWSKAAAGIGAALGGVTVLATKFANESEVANQRLQASIEATGASYDDYADSIKDASDAALQMAFDDEEAVDALAALTQGTGDAQRALDDLSLVMDIARARGISLADASRIVIAAEQGRITSLRRLGISIDENATREEALAALQTKFAGQAEAYAETNAATWDRVGNTIENKLESIGGTLVDFQGPILALSTAGVALGPLSDAFTALDGKAKLAAASSKALHLALSPAGLLGIVGGLTAGMVYLVATTDEFSASAQAAEDESADLANSYAALAASIDDVIERERTRSTFAGFSGLQEQAQKDLRTYEELQNAVDEWQSEFPQLESVAVGALISINEETQEWLDFNRDGRISLQELTGAVEQFGDKALLTSDQASQIGESLTQALSHADVDINRVLDDFSDLEQRFRSGKITGDQFADGVQDIADSWGEYTPYALEAAGATNQVTDAIRFATTEWHAAVPVLGDLTSEVEANTEAMGNWYVANHASVPVIEAIVEQTGYATKGLGDLSTGADNTTTASYQLGAALADLGQHLEDDIPDQAGRAYNSIVGYTDGLVGSIQKIKDWSDELTAPLGTDFMANGDPSRLIQLMNQGRLDVEDYNEALQAQTDIYGDLARAQDASAVIQIRSASTLAAGADATADYLENLSKLPEAELEVQLAWADSDIAGRANEIADMAAQFGNMDDAQKAAFESMVESAAATDPQLAALLESLGIIKQDLDDPTGWQLAIDDSNAQTSLGDVVDAIETLGAIILGIPDIDIDATLHTGGFWDVYNALPDSATIDVYYAYHGSIPQLALGGVVPWEGDTAAMGRSGRGVTLVGEHGPELVNLPGGSIVHPNHASRYMSPKGGGGGMTFTGPITVVANDPQSFMRQMRNYTSTMERR